MNYLFCFLTSSVYHVSWCGTDYCRSPVARVYVNTNYTHTHMKAGLLTF